MQTLARGLALVWALAWTVLGVGVGLEMGWDLGSILLHTALPGVIFLCAAVVAWGWPRAGAVLLLATGVGMPLVFPFFRREAGLLFLSLPPIAAALLLLGYHALKNRPHKGTQ